MATVENFTAWVHDFARTIAEHSEQLTDLDRAIGDGDHGSNMTRGTARCAQLTDEQTFTGPGDYLKKVGMTLVSTVGGASGPLYGTFFLRMATSLTEVDDVGPEQLGTALEAGVEGILTRGRAERGDATMYDALAPALESYRQAVADGADLAGALAAAAKAAAEGRDATTDMVARKGRASYLGDRSRGHLDPGAASATLLLESAARTLA
ncbi:dihydroxyacetone kinase subunit DhaL [Ornithinicoccus halotolerans]|uniref:dihydroxyacetone kinase subunit DhaL n=1 Tax=Ornithinicoccus halotolerans TaxID=1748220 RepID=UPI001295E7CA|nr:dihydroxyacetone kinase subunit DhaL [Ornithinicoccus halotolerans]